MLLASLPTRKNTIPEGFEVENGCIEVVDYNFNCFTISKNTIVTECGKCFDFQTYIYGFQIDDYEIDLLKEIYPFENIDYTIWGSMKLVLFDSLINCFKNSKSVKRKYKRVL